MRNIMRNKDGVKDQTTYGHFPLGLCWKKYLKAICRFINKRQYQPAPTGPPENSTT